MHSKNVVLISVCAALLCLYQIHQVCGMECGMVYLTQYLIRGGNETVKGAYPFVVILYRVNYHQPFCWGTLISNKHILTAAHCIQNKMSGTILSENDLVAHLGVYNITEETDNVVQVNVKKIHVHPGWNPYKYSFDADLAILELTHNITFTHNISPVCIPGGPADITGFVDLKGTIVGWSSTENGTYKDIPWQASVSSLNDSYCLELDNAMAWFTSNRTFCGAFDSGNIRKGDSGGGFFALSDNAWVQYGIVSAIRTNTAGIDDSNSLSIYTNVRSFKSWIIETVKMTDGVVGEAMMTIELTCRFGENSESEYGCMLGGLHIKSENIVAASITGKHKGRNSNNNVEYLQFDSETMDCLPNGIGKTFRNLKNLKVGPNLGLKLISRSNFQNMRNLLELHFFDNDIEIMQEDFFWDLPSLEFFQIKNNKIRGLHEKSFEKNYRLRAVMLHSNKLITLPESSFKNNLLLEDVTLYNCSLTTLSEKLFENNFKLKEVDLGLNELTHLSPYLFKNNFDVYLVDFSSNSLGTIDEQIFENNVKLKVVDLSSNKLEYLPPHLLKNKSELEYFAVNGNSLTKIEENFFENNIQLKIVQLSSNSLAQIPPILFVNNFALEVVEIANNSLGTIDVRTFETNGKLREVLLNNNGFESLPDNLFKNNILLEKIDVNRNSLTTIPEHFFENNPKLKLIDLSLNMVRELPPLLIRNCLVLESFDFNTNFLRTLDKEIFQTNIKLRVVDLESNLLTNLPFELFKNNLELEIVDISHNTLTTIDERIFETNIKLKLVNLMYNRLETLPKYLFRNNTLLGIVNLQNNLLKFIECDFTKLSNVRRIVLFRNICIDKIYDDVDSNLSSFESLTDLQNVLTSDCNSAIIV